MFPNGFAKCLFFPTFELRASQIFILPFTGPRDRGVKKEGRDLDPSIKDEQHLKCIKRLMNTLAQGWKGVSCGLMLNDTPWNRFTFDLLQARRSRETVCFEGEKRLEVIQQDKENTQTFCFVQILN